MCPIYCYIITNNSTKHQSFVYIQLNDQTVPFQAIQFSIRHLFVYTLNVKQFYLSHRTLSGATTPYQNGLGSNGNEGVLHIPQSSSITGASPPDCLMSYPGHSLGGVGVLLLQQRCSQCIQQSQPTESSIFFCDSLMCFNSSMTFTVLKNNLVSNSAWWEVE